MKIVEPSKAERNKHQINALAFDYKKKLENEEEFYDLTSQNKVKTKGAQPSISGRSSIITYS